MFQQPTEKESVRKPMHDAAAAGDGKHHHQIDEDDGGGFTSKHTHPDGKVEHGDHIDYDEAKSHMDKMFGHGSEDEHGDDDKGMDMNDVAGSYGRACEGDD